MDQPRTGPRRIDAFHRAAFALLGVCAATAAHAQTIRPVVAEYAQGKVQGRFEVVNEGRTPLVAVLEPKSFDLSEEGERIDRPLDPAIQLKLSSMTFRIPPRQARMVFYEVTSDSAPGWFVITCTLAGPPKRNGLVTRIELPHTVYLLPSGAPRRDDLAIGSAAHDPAEHAVHLLLENSGDKLALAQEIEVIADGRRERHASVPLLPHSRRRVRVPWDAAREPDRVSVRFAYFTLERSLREAAQAGD